MKTQAPYTQTLKLSDLVMDKTIQMRAALNRNAILDYGAAMEAGDGFPPVVVFTRFGKPRYLADGFHRILARKHLAKKYPEDPRWKTVEADIHDGGKREAILYAVRANALHGVRRTNEDKRKAVITLLKDAEWRRWADTEIGRACGVSPPTVAKYREWLRPSRQATHEEIRTYIDREGRERTRTVPKPVEDPHLDEKVRMRRCPFCGQRMKEELPYGKVFEEN